MNPAQAYKNEDLYKSLSDLGVIDPNILNGIYQQAITDSIPLDELLINRDLVTPTDIGRIISDLINIPTVNLNEVQISDDLLAIIPELVARRQLSIVFGKDKNGLKMAMNNPKDLEFAGLIAKKTGERINLFFATRKEIENALAFYKKDLQSKFENLVTNKETPIITTVDTIVEYAYANRASDIHIEPLENDTQIRFRIDGVLHDALTLPKSLHEQIVTRVKVLSNLRTDEHLSAQDGKMQIKLAAEELDIRVSVVPITNGEKVVLRLLSSKVRQFGLSDLGLSDTDLGKVKTGFTKPYGMILSTGPTGSGKTTTIYAILKIINSREKNIATIEDPVEYEIDGINQIQVNPKTNLTFADGLRSILRQDPDIMYVGEIRDNETAGIAINSAMTGHLVLSTLHTNDAATTLPRLIDMGIEPFLVASTVNVIIGQRLVRKICEKCRLSKTVNSLEIIQKIGQEKFNQIFGAQNEIRIYEGKGCDVCHQTGYLGRVGIFEVLVVSDTIKEMIVTKTDAGVLAGQAVKEGMTTMYDDGLKKVTEGITTFEEVLRATKE